VTLAWRGVLRGDGVGEGGGEPRLMVDELLEALNVAMSVCENFGSLMAPAVKNDKANFDKVRSAWEKLAKPPTLRQLLEAEIATKIHKPGGVLKDPSAAIALVWARRSLAFQTCLLEQLTKDRSAALSACATDAYKRHLEPHHNWILKSTFKMGLNAMPRMDEFFERLGVGREPGLDRDAVEADMVELVESQQRVVDCIGAMLVELDLEKPGAIAADKKVK